MKKKKYKLRLLLFTECKRHCAGCCNNYYDLSGLPVANSYKGYDEILLTGGEPLLHPKIIYRTIADIRRQNKQAKIYLYTALVKRKEIVDMILSLIDGIVITLHEQSDVKDFVEFMCYFYSSGLNVSGKSLRLNVFDGVVLPKYLNLTNWKVRYNMQWIKNCPLPEGEAFMHIGGGIC